MSAALLLVVALLRPASTQDVGLAALYEQGRLEDIVATAGERLARDPADQDALYWSGRAELDRARALLASRGRRVSRTGLDLAQDLADAQLVRAADQLGRVLPMTSGPRADARQWAWLARSLREGDETLAAELEGAWTDHADAYAAYLRGLLMRDTSPTQAVEWLKRAGEAAPERVDFQLAWAEALAIDGQRDAALAAWERARSAGGTRADLCSALLTLLPSTESAAIRLQRLDALAAVEDGAEDALLASHRAHALRQMGRLSEAEAVLAQGTQGVAPQIVVMHAELLDALDRPREAMDLLAPLAAAGDGAALERLVDLADNQGRRRHYDVAVEAYDAVLSIQPTHARASSNRALTLARSGGGLDAYRALATAHADRADLLNDAGLAIWGGGHRDEARSLLERAAALPAGLDARENLASFLLDEQPPDPGAAGPLIEAVLADEPDRDRALFLKHVLSTMRSR